MPIYICEIIQGPGLWENPCGDGGAIPKHLQLDLLSPRTAGRGLE